MSEKNDQMWPCDVEAEQGVLASFLIGGADELWARCVQHGLQAEAFWDAKHKLIFEAVGALFERAVPVDAITVGNELSDRGVLGQAGGVAHLTTIAGRVDTPVHAPFWIDILLEKWRLRRVLRLATELQVQVQENPRGVDQVLMDRVRELGELGTTNRAKSQCEILDEAEAMFRRKLERDPEELVGIRTGLIDFDYRLGTFAIEDEHHLVIVMAPPSHGKSALVRQWMRVNCEDGKRVVGFLRETGAKNAYMQVAANWAGFNLRTANRPPVEPGRHDFDSEEEYLHELGQFEQVRERWRKAKEETFEHFKFIREHWADKRLWIYDADKTIGEIESRCRMLAQRNGGLDMVVVDYLQIVRSDRQAWSREHEIADISSRFHDLGKELGCPVFALAQMNREGRRGVEKVYYPLKEDGKPDKTKPGEKYLEKPMPQLEDLRESGAIEQDADVVIGIYHPALDYRGFLQRKGQKRTMIELHKLKDRNGPVGKARFWFDAPYTRFCDIGNVTKEGVYKKKGQY